MTLPTVGITPEEYAAAISLGRARHDRKHRLLVNGKPGRIMEAWYDDLTPHGAVAGSDWGSLIDWIEDGELPAHGFLRAMLRGDLVNMTMRATGEEMARVPVLLEWLYDCAPALCWGSVEAVAAWRGVDR